MSAARRHFGTDGIRGRVGEGAISADFVLRLGNALGRVLASGRPADANTGALPLNADAAVLAGTLAEGQTTELTLAPGRAAYLVAVNGSVTVNDVTAQARDGVAIADERSVTITAAKATEIVVVDVAA